MVETNVHVLFFFYRKEGKTKWVVGELVAGTWKKESGGKRKGTTYLKYKSAM